VDGVLFKPLPYPEAGHLYAIETGIRGVPKDITPAPADKEITAWSRALPDVAMTGFRVQPWSGYGSGVNDDAAGMATVQANFFDVIRVWPLLGGFRPEDFATDSKFAPVVVMYDIWQRRFGGDPATIGRTVNLTTIGDRGYRIVGVMPPGFVFPTDRWDVAFLTPALASDASGRRLSQVVARVPSESVVNSVGPRLEAAMHDFAAAQPARGPKPADWSESNWRASGSLDYATVSPLARSIGKKIRPFFNTAFVAVLFIVLLGALNASALLASRVLDRQAELDVRRALGASTLDIAQLVFIETLTLVAVGACLGLTLAPMLLNVVRLLLPEDLVLLRAPAVDWRVAGFVLVSIVAMAVPASTWPIWRTVRQSRLGRAGDRGTTRAQSAGTYIVIAAQVAGAFALTVIGALLVRSLLGVYAIGHPIRTDAVVLLEGVIDDETEYQRPSLQRTARVMTVSDGLRRTAGVIDVAVTGAQVLDGGNWVSRFEPPTDAAHSRLTVDLQSVTASYYRVVQPQLVTGRLPTDNELAKDAHVVVVSESLARAYWPRVSAVNQTLVEHGDDEPYLVVGVVKDVRWQGWDMEAASIYGPFRMLARWPYVNFLIQTDGHTGQVMHDAMAGIASIDPHMRVVRAATLDDLFVETVRPRRFQSWLFGSYAVAALSVVGVGVFGILGMTAARRTREIGIRQALGATRTAIANMMVRGAFVAAAIGIGIGAALAAWGSRFVSSWLYGMTAADPVVWTVAAAVIVGVAAAGALTPALRASRIDPVRALRED
jgi:predicted permease